MADRFFTATVATVAVVLVLLASAVFAGPNMIAYQGSVVNSSGAAVGNGTYRMRFRIYDAASGGVLRWEETETAVSVQSGLFSVTLGDGTAFGSLFANYANLWLEVAIDLNRSGAIDAAEIYAPRQKLAEAAWAMNAERLQGKQQSDFAAAGHTHPGLYWSLSGNAGLTSGTHFLGTTNNVALDLRTSNTRVFRFLAHTGSPNLIGGHSANSVGPANEGATISGGGNASGPNRASSYATVGGGQSNTASSLCATVGGGYSNTASGFLGMTVVGGGFSNAASGFSATVAGGAYNTASGFYATVGGGDSNTARGDYSFAAGRRAKANRNGCFVWADSTDADVFAAGTNRFVVRANGGIWLGKATVATSASIPAGRFINTSTGGYLSTGGAWTDSSDRNAKENFQAVDGQDILSRLAQLPITQWNYKEEDTTVPHVGPVAQDFHALFGLGQDDRHIAALDGNGVALAAIQELCRMWQEKVGEMAALKAEKNTQVAELKGEIAELRQQNTALEARLAGLERLVTAQVGPPAPAEE
jgi:hypothetical protein